MPHPPVLRPRVLVVLLSAGFAGTERHAVELVNALARRGPAALLLRARPADPARHVEWDALRAAVAPEVPVYLASRAAPAFGLWRALIRFRPQLIHAHYERSARIASAASRGVPVLATVHMHVTRDFLRCDGLVCLTPEQAREVPTGYRGEVAVVGNWVLPRPPPPVTRLEALRTSLGLPRDAYVVGGVGRLVPQKAFDGLLRAFAAAALPESRLVIAGDGPERPSLTTLVACLGLSGRVTFTGFLSDVRELYPVFDLFVLNSHDEPYGLVILEAAAACIPVIATATTGARAIAAKHPLRLVPCGDIGALAAALHEAWTRRDRTPPPLEGFAIEDRVAELDHLYRRLTTRKAA